MSRYSVETRAQDACTPKLLPPPKPHHPKLTPCTAPFAYTHSHVHANTPTVETVVLEEDCTDGIYPNRGADQDARTEVLPED
jgi:hypothetical protein